MAKGKPGYMTGSDAAYIEPKFVPNFNLMARDDSGGPEFNNYTAAFGDGEFKVGAKPHLSVSGGTEDAVEGDYRSDKPRTTAYDAISKAPKAGDLGPSSSKKEQME